MIQSLIEDLPPVDYPLDPEDFSERKRLYDYQRRALINAHRFLHYYYLEISEDRETLWREYVKRGFNKRWEGDSDIFKGHFRSRDISYKSFVNRASFWMATGSGKTLVIVKLIELLDYLMETGTIPKREILFLTQREDLVESFKRHVEEYNRGRHRRILLEELKNFHNRKANPHLYDRDNILVFHYRSDLISDRRGEKILHYENYHNDGNWYLILDEAHKGDNEESKRKQIFNLFTKNGFLFNFSATFTDDFDRASTIFRFNLADFVRRGYGKHVAVMETQTAAFRDKDTDYTHEEKKEIILKLMILTGFLRKIREKRYPAPLCMVLVNTVNTEDADLRLFFSELFRIAEEGVEKGVFERVRNELLSELAGVEFWAEEEKLGEEEVKELFSFNMKDLYEYFFSSPGRSKPEILYHRENRQEIAFQLKNAEAPFAIVRIGDVTGWLKTLSVNVETRELLEREEHFINIDDKESVSLLAGSRSFYEGWDSPRPNVIAYINIGGRDAKKFLLQSLGRGVRVKIREGNREYRRRQDFVRMLETLYVFTTNRTSVLSVIGETLQEENEQEWERLKGVERNPAIAEGELILPVYADSHTRLRDKTEFYVGSEDYKEVKALVENTKSDVVLSMLVGVNPNTARELRNKLTRDGAGVRVSDGRKFRDPLTLIKSLGNHLSMPLKEVVGFEDVGERINHYRKIEVNVKRISVNEKRSLENVIEKKVALPSFRGVSVMWFPQHFYLPLLVAEEGISPDELEWIRRVIKHESEVRFLKDLFKKAGCLDSLTDRWVFSRIDESSDEVYIPYYDGGKELRWYPDFIIWLSRGNDLYVLFVDPKGSSHAGSYTKLDGARELFEDERGEPRVFESHGRRIRVLFFLYNPYPEGIPTEYQRYWVTGVEDMCSRLSAVMQSSLN